MHTPSAAAQLDWMLQVEHLVIEQIFHRIFWHLPLIKNPADYNRVVRRIIVAQALSREVIAPCELWTSHQSIEEPAIQLLKNLIQIIELTFWRVDPFASPNLPYEMCFLRDVVARDVAAITHRVLRFNLLAIELGQQDVSDRKQHCIRRPLEQVRQTDKYLFASQADSVIDICEVKETKFKLRHSCPRTQFTISDAKNV